MTLTFADTLALLAAMAILAAFVDLNMATTVDVMLVPAYAVVAVGTVKLGYAWLASRAGNLSLIPCAPVLARLAASMLVLVGVLLVGSAVLVR